MQNFRRFARPMSYLVLVCVLGLGNYAPAVQAAMIATETVADAGETRDNRHRIQQLLNRDTVKTYLEENGVDPSVVQERVDNLSDHEIDALAARLDAYPAGEGFETLIVLAFLAFLALLITDILGYTDIFPFVKKSAE